MFRRKKTPQRNLPKSPTEYPVGICVKTDVNHYLINKDGKRYRIPTERVLKSWNFPLIVETTEAALTNYPTALTPLAFRDGSLLNNIADGKLYLVSGGKLRHIVSPDFFERTGISSQMATVVSDAEIKNMKVGVAIS